MVFLLIEVSLHPVGQSRPWQRYSESQIVATVVLAVEGSSDMVDSSITFFLMRFQRESLRLYLFLESLSVAEARRPDARRPRLSDLRWDEQGQVVTAASRQRLGKVAGVSVPVRGANRVTVGFPEKKRIASALADSDPILARRRVSA